MPRIMIEDTDCDQLAEGVITEVRAGQKTICLLKKEGRIYAFARLCPHQGTPLKEGWLDARGKIVCCTHHYRFDPANGYNSSGEGFKLRTFPAEVDNDRIFVLLPD